MSANAVLAFRSVSGFVLLGFIREAFLETLECIHFGGVADNTCDVLFEYVARNGSVVAGS